MVERGMVEWAPGRVVTTRVAGAGGGRPLVLAHGAGTDQDHDLVTGLRDGLAAAGIPVVTFDYPYMAEGRRRPDRPDVLLACHAAVVDAVGERSGTEPVIGGRSMGGRMATMLAAGGAGIGPVEVAGVVAFAYPLHPAGKPDRLRVEHLSRIEVPVLMVVGDRDTMCRLDLYDEHVRPLGPVTTHVLAGADHSWRVTKASGRTRPEVVVEAVAATVGWLSGL
ncbi:MAG: alpha/beta fold hydrolase [Acidimicrobiia bacterium]